MVVLQNHKTQQMGPQPGDLLVIKWPDRPQRDMKSKGLLIPATGGPDREKK